MAKTKLDMVSRRNAHALYGADSIEVAGVSASAMGRPVASRNVPGSMEAGNNWLSVSRTIDAM